MFIRSTHLNKIIKTNKYIYIYIYIYTSFREINRNTKKIVI